MPVSGLVIVLGGRDAIAAVESMRANPRLEIGPERVAGRLPVVLETASHAESRAQLEWLRGLPGVALVEIAYVDQTDVETVRPPRKEQAP